LRSAARKRYGAKIDIEANFNDESGEIEVFQFKEVVEKVDEPDLQISLEEGRKLDPECEVGDSLGTKMDATTFGRIAAQSAKQVIIQKLKDAERDAVYASFIERKSEIINGIVQRFDRGDIIVNLGNTEAILPVREQVPRESYRRGDRIRALILDVLYETPRAPGSLDPNASRFSGHAVQNRSARNRRRHRGNQGRRARTGQPRQNRRIVSGFGYRSGGRLRGHEGQPGAERGAGVARRKNRYHSLACGCGQVRLQCAGAG
jgi:hypothetical protein